MPCLRVTHNNILDAKLMAKDVNQNFRDVQNWADKVCNVPSAKMYLTSGEVLTSLDQQWVRPGSVSSSWNEAYDSGHGIVDLTNERLVIPMNGVYSIKWSLRWDSTSRTDLVALTRLQVSGSTKAYGSEVYTNGTSLVDVLSNGSADLSLSKGDAVTIEGYYGCSITPVSWNYTGGEISTWVSISMIKDDS